jgi:hypothetical protein
LLEQGGFAGTWAAHHIETEQLPGIEMGTVVLGLVLVGSQEVEPEGVLEGHMHGKDLRMR